MIKFLIETLARSAAGRTEDASISFSTFVSMPSLTLQNAARWIMGRWQSLLPGAAVVVSAGDIFIIEVFRMASAGPSILPVVCLSVFTRFLFSPSSTCYITLKRRFCHSPRSSD